jgi:outer membrane murein-binding lipoprotein Lpp
MNSKTISMLLAVALVSMTFLGCASVPKEELDEKEAIIKNLNTEITGLKADIAKLEKANEDLAMSKSGLEEKISRLQKELSEKQKIAEEKQESSIK